MKKRIWALLLALCLVLQLGLPVASADEREVYFTAAGESVLPLSDATMPFWRGGYLYIPSTMFTDNVWRSLGISYIKNNKGTVILHSASQAAGQSLLFEKGKDYVRDSFDRKHQPGAVERNGIVFVPAFLVADFFGLLYSVTKVPHGYLVWLRKPGFGLNDAAFADAANYNMENEYSAYLKAMDRDKAPDSRPGTDPTVPASPGAGIYLCLEAGEETEAMLEELDRAGSYAAFFCSPDFLEQEGDLLRRMVSTGQTVGILADGENGAESVAEQLDRGNRALERATCSKTRLAYLNNSAAEDLAQAEAGGYVPLKPQIDRTAYHLKSAANASSLMKRVSSYRSSVSVWVGDTADRNGLRQFLLAVDRAEDRCFALTETAAVR